MFFYPRIDIAKTSLQHLDTFHENMILNIRIDSKIIKHRMILNDSLKCLQLYISEEIKNKTYLNQDMTWQGPTNGVCIVTTFNINNISMFEIEEFEIEYKIQKNGFRSTNITLYALNIQKLPKNDAVSILTKFLTLGKTRISSSYL